MEKENLSESEQTKIGELLQQWEKARPFSNNPGKAKEIFDEAREWGIELELYEILLKLYMKERNETF